MTLVVHFNMLVEMNQLLKDRGIEYSIHSIGGCTCTGLQLRQDGQPYDIKEIVAIMNAYLEGTWIRVLPKQDNPFVLDIVSKFPHEDHSV